MKWTAFRARLPFVGRGVILPEFSGSIPEPDEELPDSDLSDTERLQALERERRRRQSRDH